MLVRIVLLCLVLLCFDAQPIKKPKHTMLIGELKPGDQVLFMIDLRKDAKKDEVLTEYVKYPPEKVVRNLTISFIVVLSQAKDFKGGYPTIISGGVGFKHVTIRVDSEKGCPIDYLVGVYGQ